MTATATAARLALGTLSALGLARFAYGLLLPAMRADLGWTLAQAGAMTTANGVGYLAGALAAAVCARRWGATATFRAGMLLIAASLAATALTRVYPLLLLARAGAGIGGALVFVTGGVIAARLASGSGTSTPITVYFAGTGPGIVLSGVAIPVLVGPDPGAWPVAWAGLGAVAAVAAAGSWTAARSADPPPAAGGGSAVHGLGRTAVAYVLFAAGYIAYVTFLSATLAERAAPTVEVVVAWSVLGLGVAVSPLVWSRPMATAPSAVLAGLLLLLATSGLLALTGSVVVVVASAALYGATFMAVPAAVTALVRARTPPADWPRRLAGFTVLFAAGQTVGPWAAGAIADATSADAPLVWTAALCLAGGVVAASERVGKSTTRAGRISAVRRRR